MPSAYPDPVDDSYRVEDGGAAVTATRYGKIAGAVHTFDTGAGPVQWGGVLVFDVSAITTGSGRSYALKVVASNTADLSTGVVELKGPLPIAAIGQQAIFFENKVITTLYRYVGIQIIPAGTSPSITLTAWLIPTTQFPSYSQAEILGLLGIAGARQEDATAAFRAWTGGVVGGGPGSDGKYPLFDGFGTSYLIACPAQMAHDASAAFSVTTITGKDLLAEVDNDPELDSPEILVAYDPAAAAGGPTLFKAPIALFASRRTQDLHGVNNFIGDELVQVLTDPTGAKLSKKIAWNELQRLTHGVYNPRLPPYNSKFNARFARTVVVTSGDQTVEFPEAIFPGPYDSSNEYVGAEISLSNVGTVDFFGCPLLTTITAVNDSRHCEIAATPTISYGFCDCTFGHDDSAGNQAFLNDLEARTTYSYGGVGIMPAGFTLTGSLKYKPRSGLYGRGPRQTMLLRRDDRSTFTTEFAGVQSAPTLWNDSRDCDFPGMADFGIHGARFNQVPLYPGFLYWSRTGGENLPQVDPYPVFTRMHVVQTGFNAFEMRNRNSGSIAFIEVIGSGGNGYHLACYDANVINVLSIGHDFAALFVEGANNNIQNFKGSFSGVNDWLYGLYCNAFIGGQGNQLAIFRMQESLRSNMVIGGNGNVLSAGQLDDTGCIHFQHSFGTTGDIAAAIEFHAGATDNRFNDVGYGPAVHIGSNYASHGMFFRNAGGQADNKGRIYSKAIAASGGYYDLGVGGAYAPRAVGTDYAGFSAGIDTSNTLTLDEGALSAYYP